MASSSWLQERSVSEPYQSATWDRYDAVLIIGVAMRRREFLGVLGGVAVACPLAARAQEPAMPVVGFLRSTAAATSAHFVDAFRQGLNEAGFVEGQNVSMEYRWADNQLDRLPAMAADLVRLQVALIIANGVAAPAAKAATATIPIVFTTGFDPVRTGLVNSLSRPEANITGVVFTVTDLAAKQLGLLHELVPKATVIAVLGDPSQQETELGFHDVEAAGRALGRKILIVKRQVNTSSMPPLRRSRSRVLVRCWSLAVRCSFIADGSSSRWRRAMRCPPAT
jgi:ABC-type uncharacterized transport system substrate-binding protein